MDFIKISDLPNHSSNVCKGTPKEIQPVAIPEYDDGNTYRILNTKKPFTCPVCVGRGFVSGGFYSSTGNTWVSSTTAPDTCRSCKGTGVVWSD